MQRPRILGLTASPVVNAKNNFDTKNEMNELEKIMDWLDLFDKHKYPINSYSSQ
jgi:hypothetical protein